MKLSHAHMRILIGRQFLLSNFTTLGQLNDSKEDDPARQNYIGDCMKGVYTIIDTGMRQTPFADKSQTEDL